MVQAIDDDGLGDEFRVLEHQICQSKDLSRLTEQESFLLIGRCFVLRLLLLFFWVIIRATDHFFHHVHDFLLDQIQSLGIPSWSSTDHIVDLDIVVLLADTSAVHCVGEFDKDRIPLHDTLDVLSTNANYAFMVLVGHMKRDGGRHFLLYELQSILSRIVLGTAYVNVEIVFVEAIENDLDVACPKPLAFGSQEGDD